MKRISSLVVGLFFAISVTALYADNVTVGVVDLQKIIQTSPQMKVIQQKLEKDFKPRRDKLVAMEQGLKKDIENFKRDSTVLSETQKKELEKKILAGQQLFEREGQQYQQELSTAHNEAMEGLYTKIRAAIKKVAEAKKYDIVLQKDAAPYSIEKLDLTSEIIKNIA